MRTAFTITIFVGAVLLFAVQPMVGKLLLPWLGGAPAVWNTCMVFFQAILLAGYAYAHVLTKLPSSKWQVLVHMAVMAAGLAALPLALRLGSAPPNEASPIPWLILRLLLTAGMPLFVVSANSPLLQRWFASTDDPLARDPYFLYAASNAGSLMALLAYPVLIEPALGLAQQRLAWSRGFALFGCLVLLCGLLQLTRRKETEVTPAASGDAAPPRPTRRDYAKWLLLAFVPSSLMLAVTQHITIDIAAVPLLWVVPLALYLLTFVAAFARRQLVSRSLWSWLLAVISVATLATAALWGWFPAGLMFAMHLALLFTGAMVCHGRLAASRPHPQYLTGFYLAIALGGALGGVFNAIVAPQIFVAVLEYPLVIALAFLLRDRAALAWTGAAAARWTNRGLDAAMVILAAVVMPYFIKLPDLEVIEIDRTFFGVHRIAADEDRYWLGYFNGTTVHNVRIADHPRRPLTYYHDETGIGQLYLQMAGDPRLDRVGVVGLGAGALAARAKAGQHYTFYEIDPAVVRIALNTEYFTYLSGMPRTPTIVVGDGRLSLAREPDEEFGLIVLDAFSSDSIPAHLLTVEALGLYFDKLAPDGLLAVHATNRYLDLGLVVGGLARARGLLAVDWLDARSAEHSYADGILRAWWIVLARDEAALRPLLADPSWQPLEVPDDAPVWTDGHSNLLTIMKWWR
ncbi:MAG: spermidine synthase [Planctomycetota bacterium]|jgi:hypothetical protein